MKNLTKTTKLMLTLIVTVAFFTIFSAKTDAATIEKIVFDNRYYIASNLDLEQYYGFNDYAGAYEHFNYHGINEGRAGSPLFDVTYYKEVNPDLSGMTNEDAYEHFIYHGIAEGRTASKLFNVKYYLDTYPDLKNTFTNEDGEVDYAAAYDHYLYNGIYEGRSPNANLDVDHYIFANADLKETFVKDDGIDYEGAAEHYFFHGVTEGRETKHTYAGQHANDNKDGTHSLICDVCGLTSEVKEPHEMGDYEITETTHKKHCTKCDFCEEEEQQHTFKVTGYTFEEKEKLADGELPTATATVACLECGKELSVPATVVGAADEEGNAVYDVEVTCLVDGERTFIASVEDYEDAEGVESSKKYTIEALGHKLGDVQSYKWVEDEEKNLVVEATGACTVCGEETTETLVPVVDEENSVAPTCTNAGYTIYAVEINGQTATKRVENPAIGHNYVELEAKNATCVESGINEGYAVCENCNLHFIVSRTEEEVKYTPVVNEEEKPWEIPANGEHDFSESPIITIDENGKDPKFSELFSATAKETCLTCGKAVDIEWARINVDKKVSGSCGTEGASVTYTVTATGSKGLKATKTVSFDLSTAEHVEKYVYNATGHAKSCEVCGANLNADSEVEFENHKFEYTSNGDAQENGRVIAKHQKTCTVCGYSVEENCTMVPTLTGFTVKEDEHICKLCHRIQSHDSYEWKKEVVGNKAGYTSNCSACEKETVKLISMQEVLKRVPDWATNENPYITITYPKTITCNFDGSGVTELPKGVKLVFENGSTCTFNCNFKVKGVIEIQDGATCKVEQDNSLTVDETVAGAKVEGKVEGKFIKEINTPEAFKEALNEENIDKVVVSGDIEVANELATLSKAKTVTINAGSTMKVTGKLVESNLTLEGEGTVKLANNTDTDNGTNLTNVFKAGAKNVELASDTTLKEGSETDMSGKLTIDEGVIFTTEAGAHITDKGNASSSLTLNGTWKVEGEIRDLDRCTFGTNSLIELASDTEENNGKSLVICAKADVPNVKLDENAKLENDKKLEVDANVKLDLNNKKVSKENQERIAEVATNGNLTISNGTIEAKQGSTPDTATLKTEGTLDLENVKVDTKGYGVFVGNAGKLIINGGTFTSSERPCIGTNNSTTTNSNITVTNATLTTTKDTEPAVFLPAKGEATFDGCTIKGGTAIEAVGLTTLNLKGKTSLEATKNSHSMPTLPSGEEASGSPILVVSRNGYSNNQAMTINVGKDVTFETAITGNEIGKIEVRINNSVGINQVNIYYSCDSLTTAGHQSGNGLTVTTTQKSEEELWKNN